MSDVTEQSATEPRWIRPLVQRQRFLWILAALLYGVGDSVTTVIGLQAEQTSEVGPVALLVLDAAGVAGFLGFKLVFIGVFFVSWYALSTPARVAIPLALVFVGGVVTCWNVVMLLI